MTPKQCRAARAILHWSAAHLAERAGVSRSVVADFERGLRTPMPNNRQALLKALSDAGVEMVCGGVAWVEDGKRFSVTLRGGSDDLA